MHLLASQVPNPCGHPGISELSSVTFAVRSVYLEREGEINSFPGWCQPSPRSERRKSRVALDVPSGTESSRFQANPPIQLNAHPLDGQSG